MDDSKKMKCGISKGFEHDRGECPVARSMAQAIFGQAPSDAAPAETKATSGGPALVNSKAYQDNWTSIFGKKTTAGQA